ncbi:MAG: alpha/beta hydrolase [Bryobacterales bacterium]|nr:alpha/beta hydrolase [Bryobacterales bacterium]
MPTLKVQFTEGQRDVQGAENFTVQTNGGNMRARYHAGESNNPAVLWVFGAGGGLGGPAGGVYERLGKTLAGEGVGSLQLDYRQPGDLAGCTLDVLLGLEYLAYREHPHAVLVGHSFGGAVVINTGAISERVIAVAALSSQSYGADRVTDVSPRPLLLLHGESDEVLPPMCSESLYRRAKQPKKLKTYPGCRHGLDDCKDELDRDLLDWIHTVLTP